MHPSKVDRARIARFTDLPNVGPAMAGDFTLLGFSEPEQLTGQDPYALYVALSKATNTYQDPCVLDTIMSVTNFLSGLPPQPWWAFTAERKRIYGHALAALRRAV